MANRITVGEAYDPYFYANAALRQLNKKLGMAFFVYRGYDRTARDKGSVIRLRRPGKFVAQTMPIATTSAEDILPDYQNITLDEWEGAMFKLTDQELTYTRERIISEHVDPLAIAIADKIDQTLFTLQNDVGAFVQHASTTPVEDFANIRKVMFDQKVPESMRTYVFGGNLQNAYEKESVFYQANTGVDAELLQRDGMLGNKFGFNLVSNNNVGARAANGTAIDGDTAGAVDNVGGYVRGTTTVHADGFTDTETVVAGDTVKFANHDELYAIKTGQAVATADIDLILADPGLRAAVADGEGITLSGGTATEVGLAFHKEAFALAMCPLSSLGDGAGARIATVSDPLTGITLRTTIFYDPGPAANYVRMDALWGQGTLNPHMACNVHFD